MIIFPAEILDARVITALAAEMINMERSRRILGPGGNLLPPEEQHDIRVIGDRPGVDFVIYGRVGQVIMFGGRIPVADLGVRLTDELSKLDRTLEHMNNIHNTPCFDDASSSFARVLTPIRMAKRAVFTNPHSSVANGVASTDTYFSWSITDWSTSINKLHLPSGPHNERVNSKHREIVFDSNAEMFVNHFTIFIDMVGIFNNRARHAIDHPRLEHMRFANSIVNTVSLKCHYYQKSMFVNMLVDRLTVSPTLYYTFGSRNTFVMRHIYEDMYDNIYAVQVPADKKTWHMITQQLLGKRIEFEVLMRDTYCTIKDADGTNEEKKDAGVIIPGGPTPEIKEEDSDGKEPSPQKLLIDVGEPTDCIICSMPLFHDFYAYEVQDNKLMTADGALYNTVHFCICSICIESVKTLDSLPQLLLRVQHTRTATDLIDMCDFTEQEKVAMKEIIPIMCSRVGQQGWGDPVGKYKILRNPIDLAKFADASAMNYNYLVVSPT